MTGTELSAALAEKLKVLLPDCAVRPAFTGTLQRLPQRAAVTVGVMQEENADGVFETVLGVQLYARERDDHARLFDAVCAAVSSLPCALRSVKRSETTYSAALPGEFTLQTGGARYTHCVLKAASENKLVIEAGACEKITRRTQSGTEA